jgi:hypothetical protein
MSDALRLLKSIETQPGESVQSIAIRLAPFALVSIDEFLMYGLDLLRSKLPSLPAQPHALERLAIIGGFDPVDIRARRIVPTGIGYLMFKREVPSDWISPQIRRLAPGVLAADGDIPFHRLAWQLNALNCDPTTGEVLIDRCPRCVAYLTWNKIQSITSCGVCNFDVRDAAPRYAPNDRRSAARDLHAFVKGIGPALPEPFCSVDDITACRAMEWMAFFVDLPVGKHLRPACSNASAGLHSIRRWPSSFDSIVADFLEYNAAPHAPDHVLKRRLMTILIEAIDRAGTTLLRDILLGRTAMILGKPAAFDTVVHDRIFHPQKDVCVPTPRKFQTPSLRGALRIDSMRAIQSRTSAKPRAS